MKHKWCFIFLLIFTYHTLFSLENKTNYKHIKIKVSIKSTSPEIIRKDILKFTEEKKGYLMSFQNDFIKVNFPNDKDILDEFIVFLKGKGIIVNQNFSTIDYSEEILNLSTKIKAKEEYLQQLYQLIKEANLIQTLEIEKEISKNIEEIEALKGDYNYYLELSSRAEVEIKFLTLEQRNLPSTTYPEWISRLGILNFWSNFHE